MHDNPFLSRERFPRFDALAPEAAREAMPELLARAEEKVAALEAHCEPTWEGRVAALREALAPVSLAWHLVEHMLSTCNAPAWREAEEALQPEVVRFFLRVSQSRPLHAALLALREGPGWGALPEGRRRAVEAALRDARDAGVALEGAARERFVALSQRLSELSTKFENNTLDATKAFALLLREEAQVAGLPPAVRALCAASAREAGETDATAERGPWRVTLELPIYGPVQQFAEDAALREKTYRARVSRASAGAFDNGPVLAEILALRGEMARLLAFPSYAAFALDSRMAKTPRAVHAAIDRVAAAAVPRAREELAALRAFAAGHGAAGALRHWDLAYWSRRRKEALHGYSSETLRPYLPFPRVLEGLFGLARELFGVAVEPCDGLAPVWHPDVRLFRVRDAATGEARAHFYLDPWSRPATKRGGAWMDCFRTRERRPDGSLVLPLALLCCNLPPPAADGAPSLLTLGDVETLFHEFGHALQCMLTRVDDPEVSGIDGIEWDAVELASQFMENWCFEPAILRALSSHVETGAPLPDELVARVRGARAYGEGLATARQLSFAELDLELHEEATGDPAAPPSDPAAAAARAAARYAPLPPLPEGGRRRPCRARRRRPPLRRNDPRPRRLPPSGGRLPRLPRPRPRPRRAAAPQGPRRLISPVLRFFLAAGLGAVLQSGPDEPIVPRASQSALPERPSGGSTICSNSCAGRAASRFWRGCSFRFSRSTAWRSRSTWR